MSRHDPSMSLQRKGHGDDDVDFDIRWAIVSTDLPRWFHA